MYEKGVYEKCRTKSYTALRPKLVSLKKKLYSEIIRSQRPKKILKRIFSAFGILIYGDSIELVNFISSFQAFVVIHSPFEH
jgi:hypothetical protein